jgi:hypothetical protein
VKTLPERLDIKAGIMEMGEQIKGAGVPALPLTLKPRYCGESGTQVTGGSSSVLDSFNVKITIEVDDGDAETPVMTPEERDVMDDAIRYSQLVQYMISDRTDLDDAFVAAKYKEEYDALIDGNIMPLSA